MRTRILLVIITTLSLMTGCATVLHGTKQVVPINSEPVGAKVYVDGDYVGITPTEVKLSRSKIHKVGLAMVGHEMGIIELTPQVSPASWYNVALLPGVFAGFLIDSITGGLYELSQGEITHHKVKQEAIPQVQ